MPSHFRIDGLGLTFSTRTLPARQTRFNHHLIDPSISRSVRSFRQQPNLARAAVLDNVQKRKGKALREGKAFRYEWSLQKGKMTELEVDTTHGFSRPSRVS